MKNISIILAALLIFSCSELTEWCEIHQEWEPVSALCDIVLESSAEEVECTDGPTACATNIIWRDTITDKVHHLNIRIANSFADNCGHKIKISADLCIDTVCVVPDGMGNGITNDFLELHNKVYFEDSVKYWKKQIELPLSGITLPQYSKCDGSNAPDDESFYTRETRHIDCDTDTIGTRYEYWGKCAEI